MKLLPVRFLNHFSREIQTKPLPQAIPNPTQFFRHLLLELPSSEKQKPSNVDLEDEPVIQSEVLMNFHKEMILLLVWEDQDQIMDNLTGLLKLNVTEVNYHS